MSNYNYTLTQPCGHLKWSTLQIDRHRHTDRHTDRHIDRQTDRHTDRQIDR